MALGVPSQVVGYELPDKAGRAVEYDVTSSHREVFLHYRLRRLLVAFCPLVGQFR